MNISKEYISLTVATIIVVVLQIVLGSFIRVFNASPNFVLAFTAAYCIVSSSKSHFVYAFVVGIVYNLFFYGPMGSFSLLLMIVAFAMYAIYSVLDNSSPTMSCIVLFVTCFVVEALYLVCLMVFAGYNVSFFEGITKLVIFATVMDTVIAIIFVPLTKRFVLDQRHNTVRRGLG